MEEVLLDLIHTKYDSCEGDGQGAVKGGLSILWVVVDVFYVGPPALKVNSDTCKRRLGLFLSDTGE